MPIYTTYLGFLNKHGGAHKVAKELGSCFVYYVMRNRGNNEVAPTLDCLKAFQRDGDWDRYECWYLYWIRRQADAHMWMWHRAQEAKVGNILLVCYEKDAAHCHRRLLAEEIARRFNVEYKGELS